MGRFYQTADSNFLDFAFQPNLDVAMQLANQEVKTHYAKTSLLNSVPDLQVDVWDEAHGEQVAGKKQEYEGQIEAIAQELYKSDDPNSLQRILPKLRKVRQDLTTDYTSGVFNTAQQSAAKHREFKEKLETLVNPSDRAAYLKHYEDSYLSGERDKAFDFGEMYDEKNIDAMFLESQAFKSIVPDNSSFERDMVTGDWIVTKGETTTRVPASKIEKTYKSFVESIPGIDAYSQDRTDVFGVSNMKDPEGRLDFSEQGYFGQKMKNMGELYSYENKSDLYKLKANEWAMIRARQSGAERIASFGFTFTPNVDVEGTFSKTPEGKAMAEQFDVELDSTARKYMTDEEIASMVKAGADTGPTAYNRLRARAINRVIENGKPGEAAYDEITRLKEEGETMFIAGAFRLQDELGLNRMELVDLNKSVNSQASTARLMQSSGYVTFSDSKYSNKLREGQKRTMDDMVDQIYHNEEVEYDDNGTPTNLDEVYYVDSIEPIEDSGSLYPIRHSKDKPASIGTVMNYKVTLRRGKNRNSDAIAAGKTVTAQQIVPTNDLNINPGKTSRKK